MSALAAEFGAIALGDRRLDRRAQRLLQQLGEKPTLSIPAACGGWKETRAAYRLFDHREVTAERVLAPQFACTEERLRAHPRVLCIQDTTELDYTTKKASITGLGPLNYESRWGMYLHPTLALTPERVPLGLLDAHTWVREPGSLGEEKDRDRPLEEKESLRWVDGFARVNALAETLTDTRLTYIADREGDIYDTFVEAPCPERGADWLVRVQHSDRTLVDGRKLREAVDAAPVLTEITFERPASNGRRPRTVHQQIKAVRVTLKPPARPDRTLAEVTVTVLLATEVQPPAGEDPLDWLLLTNLPVETPEQATEKLSWYLCRWQIEIGQPCCLHKSVWGWDCAEVCCTTTGASTPSDYWTEMGRAVNPGVGKVGNQKGKNELIDRVRAHRKWSSPLCNRVRLAAHRRCCARRPIARSTPPVGPGGDGCALSDCIVFDPGGPGWVVHPRPLAAQRQRPPQPRLTAGGAGSIGAG